MAVVTDPKRPGELFIEELGRTIRITKTREGTYYDSVEFASGVQTKGDEKVLYRDLANKFAQHSNIARNGKLPNNVEMAVYRTGVMILQATANTVAAPRDVLKAAYAVVLHFEINDRVIVADYPLYTLPTGFGVSGMTNENNTGIATIGVPSAAAAPQLFQPQPLFSGDDIGASLFVKDNLWITGGSTMANFTNAVLATHHIYGVIKQAVGA